MFCLMDRMAELVGLAVEFPAFLAGDFAIVLEGLRLSLLDLIKFALKAGGLFARQFSLGNTLIDPFFQIGFPAINVVLTCFRTTTLLMGIRALGSAGEKCESCKDWEEVMCFHFSGINPATPEKLHGIP